MSFHSPSPLIPIPQQEHLPDGMVPQDDSFKAHKKDADHCHDPRPFCEEKKRNEGQDKWRRKEGRRRRRARFNSPPRRKGCCLKQIGSKQGSGHGIPRWHCFMHDSFRFVIKILQGRWGRGHCRIQKHMDNKGQVQNCHRCFQCGSAIHSADTCKADSDGTQHTGPRPGPESSLSTRNKMGHRKVP